MTSNNNYDNRSRQKNPQDSQYHRDRGYTPVVAENRARQKQKSNIKNYKKKIKP